jgi:hypothetical protein
MGPIMGVGAFFTLQTVRETVPVAVAFIIGCSAHLDFNFLAYIVTVPV